MTTTPGGPRVRLRPLRDDDERAVRAAQVATAADGFDFDFALGLNPHLPWAGYLRRLADTRAGVALPRSCARPWSSPDPSDSTACC